MTTTFTFSPQHIVRNVQNDIHQICEPLFKQLNLNYFHYAKFYGNGSLAVLYNRMDWPDHFHSQNYRTEVPLPTHQPLQIGKYNFCLWRGTLDENLVSDARNTCNLDHPLGITIAHKDHYESFVFGTHQGNDEIINTYFNNIDSLTQFTAYFKDKAADLIKRVDQEKFVLPKNLQAKQLQILDKLPSTIEFLGKSGPINLTPREVDVLKAVCCGLTAKEIAAQFERSTRTIEEHLVNLKRKLGINSRSQLVEIALKNGICLDLRPGY